jgi:pyridoxine kinase
MARILAISSHVVRGHVGLCATVPTLQSLGHEVWALPTVLLASRPGLGMLCRYDLPPCNLASMLAALDADGCWSSIDAVFTGYFPSSACVQAVAHTITHIRAVNQRALICVDPILGDGGRLYVAPQTAAAIRDELLPLATIATPNLFELEWLTGANTVNLAEVAAAARSLGAPTVSVTSADVTANDVATLLVTATDTLWRRSRRIAKLPNGAGDVFAGLLLGHILCERSVEVALDASLATLQRILLASEGRDELDLLALDAAPKRTS